MKTLARLVRGGAAHPSEQRKTMILNENYLSNVFGLAAAKQSVKDIRDAGRQIGADMLRACTAR